MKKIIYLLIFGFLQVSMGQNQELFQEANAAYNEGKYTEAVNKYEQIIENGKVSADLYYNLGNAYYKQDQIAPSIYYYEKALQLNPNDQDVLNNLEFARNMTLDAIEEQQQAGISRMISAVVSTFSFNEWGWMAISGSVVFGAFFLLYYYSTKSIWKRLFFGIAGLSLIFALGSVALGYKQLNIHKSEQYAIVFAEEEQVYPEPNQRNEELFRLHEGTKLEVLETYDNWIKFELANGAEGWIDKKAVKFL